MSRAFKFFGIVSVAAILGLAFVGCEGPQGERGPPGYDGDRGATGLPALGPDVIVDINVQTDVLLYRGNNVTLTTSGIPGGAVVQTLVWRVYDAVSGHRVSLSRPGSNVTSGTLTGNSVVVTGMFGGEARIIVSALGSDGDTVYRTVTVRVEDVSTRLAILREMEPLPSEWTVRTVMPNEQIDPQLLYFGGENIELTLTSREGYTDTLILYRPGAPMFTVGAGVTLRLEDITLHGMGAGVNSGSPLILVGNDAVLYMTTGALVTGNNNTSATAATVGGGVRVESEGTFVLNGGAVSGNRATVMGGGVLNTGTFTMHSGTVSGNYAVQSGNLTIMGGGVINFGTFTMHNGRIFENSAVHQGGGVQNEGIFVVYYGDIFENTASNGAGVSTFGVFTMHDGNIFENAAGSTGGGVRAENTGTFVMIDGKIFDNTSNSSGGVRVDSGGTFVMEGGVIFNNFVAFVGAGVQTMGAFRMHDGAVIRDNTAGTAVLSGFGGGVAVASGAATSFRMYGGTISGNHAYFQGGGVENMGQNVFIVNGTIYGNGLDLEEGLRNTSPSGAAVFNLRGLPADGPPFWQQPATTRHGTFDGEGDFVPVGYIPITDDTIRVEGGELLSDVSPAVQPLSLSVDLERSWRPPEDTCEPVIRLRLFD